MNHFLHHTLNAAVIAIHFHLCAYTQTINLEFRKERTNKPGVQKTMYRTNNRVLVLDGLPNFSVTQCVVHPGVDTGRKKASNRSHHHQHHRHQRRQHQQEIKNMTVTTEACNTHATVPWPPISDRSPQTLGVALPRPQHHQRYYSPVQRLHPTSLPRYLPQSVEKHRKHKKLAICSACNK
jgi:hypothetical protein